MGLVVRHEPVGIEFFYAYPKSKKRFGKVGWILFLQKFQGYDNEVTKVFARSFDGVKAQIGDAQLILTYYFITEATELSRDGENWFKN